MWDEKCSLDEVMFFCSDGKTRNEIMDKFGLTVTEGWHVCKWLKGLPECMKISTEKINRKPSIIFTTRYHELKRLKEKYGLHEVKVYGIRIEQGTTEN